MTWHRVVHTDPGTGQLEAGPRMNQAMAEMMAEHSNATFPPIIHYAVTEEEWAELKAGCAARAKEALR